MIILHESKRERGINLAYLKEGTEAVAGYGTHSTARSYYDEVYKKVGGLSLHQEVRVIFTDHGIVRDHDTIKRLIDLDIPLSTYHYGALGLDFYSTITKSLAMKVLSEGWSE